MTYKVSKVRHLATDETQVTITKEEPYTYITRLLEGDLTNVEDEKVIQLMQQKVVNEFDPHGYIVRLEHQLNASDSLIADTRQLLDMVNEAFLEFSLMLLPIISDDFE